MIKIELPKRHYFSNKSDSELQPAAWRLPVKLMDQVKQMSQRSGWRQHTTVVAIVVDQFLFQLKGSQSLPDYNLKFCTGETKLFSARFDPVLIETLNDWAHSRQITATEVVQVALDIFVQQHSQKS